MIGPDSPNPIPPQTVQVRRTYLRLDSLDALRPAPAPSASVRLLRLEPCPVSTWRALYRQVGYDWHWHDRDVWDQERIQTRLQSADVRVYGVQAELAVSAPETIGFLELERHADQRVEIVYLGLDRRAMGRGLGGWLVTEAVRAAMNWSAAGVWLHTCTLDAPAALPNYLARGFVVERTEDYVTTLHH